MGGPLDPTRSCQVGSNASDVDVFALAEEQIAASAVPKEVISDEEDPEVHMTIRNRRKIGNQCDWHTRLSS